MALGLVFAAALPESMPVIGTSIPGSSIVLAATTAELLMR